MIEWSFYIKFMKRACGEFHKVHIEMATSVRFCLAYDRLKLDFIAFKWTIFPEEKALLTRTLSMTLRVRAKVLLHVW